MNAGQSPTAKGPVAFVPLALGTLGLLIAAVYQAQRCGMFLHSFYSFDRMIQHHLDAVAGIASLADLLGVAGGLIILKVRGKNRMVTFGTGFSAVVWLLQGFCTSL
jgi:hypothetical protein